MASTLPQRMGLKLLAAYPDIVEGRVVAQDFRAVGKNNLPGVVPDTMVEVVNKYGKLNPVIVMDDQAILKPLGGHSLARQNELVVWIFHPVSFSAEAEVIHNRELVDKALHDTIDLMPADSAYFPGEGTKAVARIQPSTGTVSDGEAVYCRMSFSLSYVRTE